MYEGRGDTVFLIKSETLHVNLNKKVYFLSYNINIKEMGRPFLKV